MGYVTKEEVECTSCGRVIRKNELQYDSPEGRVCLVCHTGIEPQEPDVRASEVLGVIETGRLKRMKVIRETVFFTADRVIVTRTGGSKGAVVGSLAFGVAGGFLGMEHDTKVSLEKSKKLLDLPLEDILKADRNNFAIPNSEITKVELKRDGKDAKINITVTKTNEYTWGGRIITSKTDKTYKWFVRPTGLSRGLVFPVTKDFEDVLGPIFGERLSVKK